MSPRPKSPRGSSREHTVCVAADLAGLAARIRECRHCIEKPTGRPLPHEPRPVFRLSATARILIAGQAPGTRVHASGVPFTDPSGDRLRSWMGVTADEFYDETRIAILPMGFCFPGLDANGSDLPPRRECARLWRAEAVAALVSVRLILAIGGYAHAWHLPRNARQTVSETVAGWRDSVTAGGGPRVFPLPHPSWRNSSWLKRNPWFEADALPVLRRLVRAELAG